MTTPGGGESVARWPRVFVWLARRAPRRTAHRGACTWAMPAPPSSPGAPRRCSRCSARRATARLARSLPINPNHRSLRKRTRDGAPRRRAGRDAVGWPGRARVQRSPAATVACPALPDALGEWRTQGWLCEMRKAPIGDNTYTLATKGQRGAKGDARGRSVELVHQVLAHWLCHRPDVAARITAPTGDRYTAASAAAVAAFQAEFSEPANGIDGIVGPSPQSPRLLHPRGARAIARRVWRARARASQPVRRTRAR